MSLATNVPLWRLDLIPDADANWKATFDRTTAQDFPAAIEAQGYPLGAALIVFCRTGGRSSAAEARRPVHLCLTSPKTTTGPCMRSMIPRAIRATGASAGRPMAGRSPAMTDSRAGS